MEETSINTQLTIAIMRVRVIAVDIEASSNTLSYNPFVIAAGVAYIDCEIGSKEVSGACKRFQFRSIRLPTQHGVVVVNNAGEVTGTPDDYGFYDKDTWDTFWATDKVTNEVRANLLIPANRDGCNNTIWKELRAEIDLYTKTAPEKVVLVSDNAAFDIGVIDMHLRAVVEKNMPWSLLYLPHEDGYKYSPIRSTNTAWKLREKGVLAYEDVKIKTCHSHSPEDDALAIAKDYASYITTYGME